LEEIELQLEQIMQQKRRCESMTNYTGNLKKVLGIFVSFALAISVLGVFNSAVSASIVRAGSSCVNLNEKEYVNNEVLICKSESGSKVWAKYFVGGSGGTVTIGIGALPATLEAFAASAPPRSFIVGAIYSALTRVELSTGTPIIKANVADSWSQVSGKPEIWVFKLIEGKKFPNGEPLNADAVKSSFDWVLNPKNKAGLRAKISDITKVEVISEYVVRITTSAPRYLIPRSVAIIPILPPKEFAAKGAAAFWRAPVGTGPFIPTSFTPNVELILEPNPFSIRVKPSATKIVFKVIPEDSSRISALRSGGLDVVAKVPTDSIIPLRKADFVIKAIIEPATYHMDLMAKTGPLADKRVRQALNYAVDKQALIDGINGGLGSIAQAQLVPQNLTGFCKYIKAYPYDLKKANALMKAAGFSKLKLTFQTSTAYITNDVLMAQAIAKMLEKLDAIDTVDVEVLEFSKFLDVYYLRGAIPRKDLYAWRMSSSPDLDALVQMERYTTGYTTHNIGYSDAKYDQALALAAGLKITSASRNSVENASRSKAFCEAGRILKDDAPILWGIHTPDIWAGKKSIDRLLIDAGGNIDLVSLGN
jgi:peptide/nickel transport system substrate-binding protein